MQREKLGSRLGFILLSAGCAIGIGNVWKFPYMVGQYGGAIFILIYLAFLAILGIPVMVMEFSMGRAAQKSPARFYQEIEPKGSKWHIHGYFALAGNYILMMFYTSVAGWMLNYFFKTAAGSFSGVSTEQVENTFGQMLGNPTEALLFMIVIIAIGFFICSFSLQKGLERVTKYMMLALLLIMGALAVNSILLEGSAEGLRFYLMPNLDNVRAVGNGSLAAGFGQVIVGAMNQAFFTLSLGIGSMAMFGSYIDKERSLTGESVNVAILDTVVAICSGLIIFPACTSFGVEVNAGPPLIFITLPNIFNHMAGGRLWGSLFFVFMSFAALSTVLAVFEVIIASCMDMWGWSRKKACLINFFLIILLALPCALGFNVLSMIQPFGEGSAILDLEDFIVSNILLPGGSLIFVLFCTSKRGWGWKNFTKEANEGKGMKMPNWTRGYMTYVLPIIVAVILIYGVVTKFLPA